MLSSTPQVGKVSSLLPPLAMPTFPLMVYISCHCRFCRCWLCPSYCLCLHALPILLLPTVLISFSLSPTSADSAAADSLHFLLIDWFWLIYYLALVDWSLARKWINCRIIGFNGIVERISEWCNLGPEWSTCPLQLLTRIDMFSFGCRIPNSTCRVGDDAAHVLSNE